jgi:hypothetical protein
MNEDDWRDSADPQAMLNYLEGKASDRKLRLFACACARRWWQRLNRTLRQALEVAERHAEGLATVAELDAARGQAETAQVNAPFFEAPAYAAALATTAELALEAARQAVLAGRQMTVRDASSATAPGEDEAEAVAAAVAAEGRAQCELLRHVVGNPFRPVAVDPDWLRGNDGAVAKIARVIHDQMHFEDLPYLADALLDVGCADERILDHCRLPADDHPRGCWLLDILLRRG